MRLQHLLLALAIAASSVYAFSQRDLEYDNGVVAQNRIDARPLGYPLLDVIPDGESGTTALVVAPNGDLYGATAGDHAYLFVFNPRHGYVQPLGVIPGAVTVLNAIVVSAAGDVYLGANPDGRILKYSPRDEYKRPIHIGMPLAVTDLGKPVPGERISAMTIDRSTNTIYGLTSPGGHFFSYSIGAGRASDLGVVAQKAAFGEKFEKNKTMSRMLVVDQQGAVFASGENGSFFRFEPKANKLEKLGIHAPAIPSREPWTVVDIFLLDPSGMIYGGTSDGYLFRLDPVRLTVTNLGKPLTQNRIDGLVRAPGGKLYGVGGDQEDMARVFSYDPSSGAYDVLGFVDVNRRPYYAWQAYVVGAMACGLDGTIYLGENERISKLYLFYPPAGDD
jgi:hypothetical protein